MAQIFHPGMKVVSRASIILVVIVVLVLGIVGGAMYLLITVGSVFLGRKITTPDFAYVKAKDGVAPTAKPVEAAFEAHGSNIGVAGFVAPGTFALASVFLISFILYYFVNWKYLSTVWPLS